MIDRFNGDFGLEKHIFILIGFVLNFTCACLSYDARMVRLQHLAVSRHVTLHAVYIVVDIFNRRMCHDQHRHRARSRPSEL